jgi:hypothetical protein
MSDTKRTIQLAMRIGAGVLLLAVAVLIAAVLIRTKPVAQRKEETLSPRSVRVIEAAKLPVRRQWRGYGAAQARDTSDVPARVTATVEEIPAAIQAGRRVSTGDLIAQLDNSDFQREVEVIEQNIADIDAQLDQIDIERTRLSERVKLEERDVELTNNELQRTRDAAQRNAANQTDLDKANRQLIAAERSLNITRESLDRLTPRKAQLIAQRTGREASLALAKQNVVRCRIVSPIDGVLESVDMEVGESVTIGQRVARVVNLSAMEVPLRLPASARRKLDLRDEVRLATTNESNLSWKAVVARIAPVDDADERTVTVYVEVAQPTANDAFTDEAQSKLLLPGMFVAGVVTHNRPEPRWVLPRRAVRSDRIMLVQSNEQAEPVITSRRVAVEFMLDGQFVASELTDDQWAVLDAASDHLSEGDYIVVDGGLPLLDGERVAPEPVTIRAAGQEVAP